MNVPTLAENWVYALAIHTVLPAQQHLLAIALQDRCTVTNICSDHLIRSHHND
jgi:hypothetical protein